MTDFSQFITEELFILDAGGEIKSNEPEETRELPEKPEVSQDTMPEQDFLAIVPNTENDDELGLLKKILQAINQDPDAIKFKKSVDDSAKQWLVFQEEAHFNNEPLTFYKPMSIGAVSCLFSKPLASLQDNKEEKGKLWLALQDIFLS